MAGAPRLSLRLWCGLARGAGLALVLVASAAAAQIEAARYEGPTERYPHGILGDAIEHDTLVVTLADGTRQSARFPDSIVFEDTEPRLVDLNGDGAPEVIVVESHEAQGARLAIWGLVEGKLTALASTPFIGQRFRWLSPTGVGAADLDGDGVMELAYVDRPHLAKTLRVWRYEQQGTAVRLREVASLAGVTNHRIGERDIGGGIRNCDAGPEIILADAAWRRVLAVRLDKGALVARDLGDNPTRARLNRALRCQM